MTKLNDLQIITIVVARCQVEVEAVTVIPPEAGSVWGRSVMKAMQDVKQAQEELDK